MDTDTKVFLNKKFKNYYFKNKIEAPDKVHKREFGFGTRQDKIRYRHKSFSTQEKLNNFLRRETPFFVSYSTAYYEYPANQPMEAKNWLGAELVFDLDIDFDQLDSEAMQEAKKQALSLVEFLENDFGFTQRDYFVNFSGNKGYHIHVVNEELRDLDKPEREMIVDYVTGTGFDMDVHMKPRETTEGYVYTKKGMEVKGEELTGPTAESRGWAKRVHDVIYDFVSSEPEEMMKLDGVGPKTAEKLYNDREKNMKMVREGRYEGLLDVTDNLRDKIIREYAIQIKDADKQVTSDTSRLIRLPETLHGGSGLKAACTDDLESFDPLVDAVAFSEEEVKVVFKKNFPEFDLMDQKWGPYSGGEKTSVPEYVAVYLMLKEACSPV